MKRCKLLYDGKTVASGVETNSPTKLAEHIGDTAATQEQADALRELRDQFDEAIWFVQRIWRLATLGEVAAEQITSSNDSHDGYLMGGIQELFIAMKDAAEARHQAYQSALDEVPGFNRLLSAS